MLPLCADNVFAKDGKGRAFNKTAYWLTPIIRLKPGWSVERASAYINKLSSEIFRNTLPTEYRPGKAKSYLKNKFKIVSASAGVSALRRDYEDPLWILMALTGCVLLMACANLANLLLARASAREREMAIRKAVGASRRRLIMQLLSESLLLAVGGTAIGLCIAQALSRALVSFLNTTDSRIVLPLDIDWHAFGFLAGLAVLTCILFGLAPAIRASGGEPAAAMHGGRNSTATRERNGLRRALVISQVALSLVLLVAAVLFTRSLQKLLSTSLGFDSHNVLLAGITANGPGLESPEKRKVLFRELGTHISSLSTVAAVAPVLFTPFCHCGWNGQAHPDNDSARTGSKEVWFNRTGPRYFATMGTPLLAGRDFNPHDDLTNVKVAIVNQTFAKSLFGGRNPVGRSFRVEELAGQPDKVYQIVGLVGDTKSNGMDEKDRSIAVFPVAQDPDPVDSQNFVIRGRGSLEALQAAVQHEVAAVNPNLLVDFHVLDVQIQGSVLRERLMASLCIAFGILAGCLSALGLYGVMSYMVVRRRSEIGIRMALGAIGANIYSLVLKDAALMVGIGLLTGFTATLLLSRYAESQLFELKARDPLSLLLAGLLLAITAAIATLLPARRAARLEPTMALREE